MASATVSPAAGRVLHFYDSPIGKKAIMAVTGVALLGFVIGHLLGNLQFYLGPEALNAYGAKMQSLGPILWVVRLGLLAIVVTHIVSAIQLVSMNNAARPEGYRKWTASKSTYASRTMAWSGPILAAFIVYHLLHFTVGTVHPDFQHQPGGAPEVYHNVVSGFSRWPAALAYIVAMAFLGFHLVHGIWSAFQSIGWNHPRYMPILRNAAVLIAAGIVLGNISIPISVLLGFHQLL